MSDFRVTEAAMRPASDARQCFYCGEPIGSLHKSDCTLVSKRVRVRLTIEYEVWCPAHWDGSKVCFHRNESSWCADNLVRELQEVLEDVNDDHQRCLCQIAHFDYVKDEAEPELTEKDDHKASYPR